MSDDPTDKPKAAGRPTPILHTVTDAHASNAGDKVQALVDDINETHADTPGFKKLSTGDFLAINGETLDNEARARGFTQGARFTVKHESGESVSGIHLFPGTQVVAGTRS